MKLILQDNRIAGTATDAYTGPDPFVPAPEGFDETRMSEYRLIDGQWVIPPPQSVSMRQARLALLQISKLADVDTAINAMPSPNKEAAQIEWEYAATVVRDSPLIAALGPALALSETDVDNLFITAATL